VNSRQSKILSIAVAATLGLSGVAYAQTGGSVAPGGGTTPPPTSPTDPGTPTTPTSPTGPTQVFPIPTKHTFGDGFGAGRNHQGVDIFAPCGTTTIAVMNAKVVFSGFQSAAGNYVVLRNKAIKRDYVYMHLQVPSLLEKGQKVVKGQFVGAVGDTGRATGCHLHFEIWKGKWYRGGRALDPLPALKTWDAYS
jgi:murein DD-endopeptidase MepM/ murein hydrolase activator NlpD